MLKMSGKAKLVHETGAFLLPGIFGSDGLLEQAQSVRWSAPQVQLEIRREILKAGAGRDASQGPPKTLKADRSILEGQR